MKTLLKRLTAVFVSVFVAGIVFCGGVITNYWTLQEPVVIGSYYREEKSSTGKTSRVKVVDWGFQNRGITYLYVGNLPYYELPALLLALKDLDTDLGISRHWVIEKSDRREFVSNLTHFSLFVEKGKVEDLSEFLSELGTPFPNEPAVLPFSSSCRYCEKA